MLSSMPFSAGVPFTQAIGRPGRHSLRSDRKSLLFMPIFFLL
ncbi:protein of unknown function [Xenorhabdus nematophila AN6/1]|nr:hypothetical protein XNW1_1240007 [Xenorhabdus nematophila str. Websteri]CEF29734.1 hypothetical protein XNW1_1980007 [Xenorhabdus nematophila str. Websteri]CEK24337.1 protein of unknown function [Xenorhabdus nematophila AN6/1]CEK24433.1 protein of unknown function [Xenorhabdus nematophila AN6/1]